MPYFSADLPSGQRLICRLQRGESIPLNFGREVLADSRLLNMPDRVDWKNCAAGQEEATEQAMNFRRIFKEYDFTQEEAEDD